MTSSALIQTDASSSFRRRASGFSDDIKVTDLLIALANAVIAQQPYECELTAVVERYAEIQQALKLDQAIVTEIEADLRGRIGSRSNNDAQFMDTIKAAGEDNNAKIIARVFADQGLPANYVDPKDAGMLLSGRFRQCSGPARVLLRSWPRSRTLMKS